MKKISYIYLVLAMLAALTACGRKNNQNATTTTAPNHTTTAPSTGMPTMPESMPTLETNIPDPSVDTQMPDMPNVPDMTGNSSDNSRHRK